ncbi:hypothetical protein GCM10027091_10840 [Streptomyces daliensis]
MLRLDLRDSTHSLRLDAALDRHGCPRGLLDTGAHRVALEEIGAVWWWRTPNPPSFPPVLA